LIKNPVIKIINSKYFILTCLIIAVVLRLAWIILTDSKPVSDSAWYYEKGIDIASGKGYSIEGIPTAYYPIGYPLFLSLVFTVFGNSIFAAMIMNLILSAGILVFTYFISKKIFDSENTGRISLFLFAIYPNFIAYTSILATEILFLFLLLYGIYILLKFKNNLWALLSAGFAWGLMSLVKPQGFFIPLLIVAFLFLRDKKALTGKLKTLSIIYIIMLITLLPWVIRNYYVFNEFFILSTNEGINLLMGNNPYATGEYNLDEQTTMYIWESSNKYPSPDSLAAKLPYDPFWTRYGYSDENTANKKIRKKAIDYIINNPSGELKLFTKKLWYNYKKGNEAIGWAVPDLMSLPPLKKNCILVFSKAANYFYYFIMLLPVLYFIRLFYIRFVRRKTAVFPLIGLVIILYFTILSLIFFGGYRFNFPALPWFIMFAAAFIEIYAFKEEKKNNSL